MSRQTRVNCALYTDHWWEYLRTSAGAAVQPLEQIYSLPLVHRPKGVLPVHNVLYPVSVAVCKFDNTTSLKIRSEVVPLMTSQLLDLNRPGQNHLPKFAQWMPRKLCKI